MTDDIVVQDGESCATPTYCAQCANVYMTEKSAKWYNWLCMKAPAEPWLNPVTGAFAADPPYKRCKDENRFADCDNYAAGPNTVARYTADATE